MIKLDELEVYQMSMDLSDEIWDLVINWNQFEKYTLGTNLSKLLIQSPQIFLKDMEDISLMKTNNFVITAEVLYLKQKHGLQKLLEEN